ncbi:MAG: ABC transporter permease [Firmicutes bacterium]|nr:ABC transporter permease [Bacillota bacterium]
MDKKTLRNLIVSVVIGGFLGFFALRGLFGGGFLGGIVGAILGAGIVYLIAYLLSLFPKLASFLANNIVTVIFVAFVLLGFMVTKEITLKNYIEQLFESVFRNSFLLLSLIIPVIAGLGMNFGIVIGAISAQLALILVRWFDIPSTLGFVACIVASTPLAMLFGWLTGKLYNNTRGQEMIAGLIVSYFASGIYLFILLFAVGGIIPVAAKGAILKEVLTRTQRNLLNPLGVGIRVSVDLGSLKYSLDGIWRLPFVTFTIIAAVGFLAWLVIQYMRKKKNPSLGKSNLLLTIAGSIVCVFFVIISAIVLITKNATYMALRPAPMATIIVIALLAVATNFLLKTKLGQDFRSVGQSQQIARVSGINVDRTRILATVISTVLAAWGMLIFLQNIGTLGTYTQHSQIGMFAVASMLVGGATTSKAAVKNAFIGVLLFQSMFILSPAMGRALFGNPLYGENFRTFMVYGVIAIALGLYIWRGLKAAKNKVEE